MTANYFGTQETGGTVVAKTNVFGISPSKVCNFGWGYVVRDEFTTNLSAGNINGTGAEPGPGTRTVTDTDGKASLSGGYYSVNGYHAVFNPKVSYAGQALIGGLMGLGKIAMNAASADYGPYIGLATGASDSSVGTAIYFKRATELAVPLATGSSLSVSTYVKGTTYQTCAIKRAVGYFAFIKGGIFTNWTIIYRTNTNPAGTTYYPGIWSANGASIYTVDYLRVPTYLWLPTPLVSDGFGSAFGTTDGLGHSEGVTGGLGAGGGGLTWTTRVGTIDISSGKAIATSLAGGDRAIATVPLSYLNVYLTAALTKGTTGCGIILRYKDLDNYIYYWHDGTNANVIKRVGGVDQAAVVSTAITYSAGAIIHAVMDGTTSYEYYNNTAAGGAKTISDADLQTGANVGIIFFDTDSTIDDFAGYARGGSENPYAVLDNF